MRVAPLVLLMACSTGPEPTPPDGFEPAAPVMRRLTESQYENVVLAVFGDEIVLPARLDPDVTVDGLQAIGASKITISPRGVELYEDAAYDIAEQAMERREAFVPCTPSSTVDEACAREALEPIATRAWRRPATSEEVDRLVAVSGSAASVLGDFHEGLVYGISAILQSPNFLFRVETGEDADGGRRYTDYEMASRLSFFLWDTLPDQELLDAAEAGELVTEAGIQAQLERMLADDRARVGLRAFISDLFALHDLEDLSKDPTTFEHMSEEVGPAAQEETLRLYEWLVFDEEGDYRDLLTTRTAFVDRKLASIYEVPAAEAEGFAQVELPEDGPRRGVLGQVSFLSLNAHPVSSSATLRGKFVREVLLCQEIPPPPADVDTSIPEPSGETPTLRDRVAEHLQDPACAGCHTITDPIGLGLENFDGLGSYRLRDNDVVIDASGEMDGTPFENPVDLAWAISDHPELGRCFARNVYRYATGRLDAGAEYDFMRYLGEGFAYDDFRVKDLIRRFVMSDAFRKTGEVE